MLGYLQYGLVFRHLRSLRRLKWVRLVQRRLEWALLVQRRPKGVLLAQSSSLLALVRRSGNLETLLRAGDSPQSFSDYSSRQGTLLRVSRTTRLARGLSSEFLGLLVSPGDSPQSFSDYSSRQGSRTPLRKSCQGSDTPPLKRLRL